MLAKLHALALAVGITAVSAQTYQRLGTCPTLGCVLPPDQADFLPGQFFDLRVEVHAPANGSEAFNDGVPDEDFAVTIGKKGEKPQDVAGYFEVDEPELEKWDFGWYEDLFAEDAGEETKVNVASKIYRRIALNEPGEYEVTLSYYDGETTVANWIVRPIKSEKQAKNIIFFIGKCEPLIMGAQRLTPARRRDDDQHDHGRPPPRAQEHQRKVPVSAADGPVPRARPPDDALARQLHN